MADPIFSSSPPPGRRPLMSLLYGVLLACVLLVGAYFRFLGIYWGEYQYLHPDERFLVWVGSDISPVQSFSEYFDAANSSLNPNNRGHGFYVYGTLPMFAARYAVEWIFGHSGFREMTQIGRPLSALADLLTVLLVFLVAAKLYDRRVAILAAAFSSAVVLQIQQSHFFTMDTFVNFFSFLAFYFAVLIVTGRVNSDNGMSLQARVAGRPPTVEEGGATEDRSTSAAPSPFTTLALQFVKDPLFWPSLGFGIALGMAVASKLNAALMAAVLPGAMIIYLLRLPPEERERRATQAFLYLMLAATVSLVVFRIFQPYAFSGPGFFGLKPNPQWVANIREQRAQSGGDVDFPPAMQWARRPVWFSFQNLTTWGLGLPLGFLAWAGFLGVGWRLLTGLKSRNKEWLHHALIWGWTAAYFTWQSMQLNPTMRYQLPIYPTLVIFAAWAIIALYDKGREFAGNKHHTVDTAATTGRRPRLAFWVKLVAIVIGGIVLALTFAYAYAFTQLYVRPITRIAASRWIYQNIPGPISLPILTDDGIYNQSVAAPYDSLITISAPFVTNFTPKVDGKIDQVYLPSVVDNQFDYEVRNLRLSILRLNSSGPPLANALLRAQFSPTDQGAASGLTFALDNPVTLKNSEAYTIKIELEGETTPPVEFDGNLILNIDPATSDPAAAPVQQTLASPITTFHPGVPYPVQFIASTAGMLTEVYLPGMSDGQGIQHIQTLELTPLQTGEATERQVSSLAWLPNPAGPGYSLLLNTPLPLANGQRYALMLHMVSKGGQLSINGMALANEGEWDDGLPLRMDGYDGFGGIYPRGLDFNMYWDDNTQKLERFSRILDKADYILISSNRQWGTLPRIPERFPLTTTYYRNLLGCPEDQDIVDCYRVARPEAFQGDLGFDLVETFTSEPCLLGICLNDQFAEEAFTVYDHPKVLIFKKNAAYDPQRTRDILGSVDFSKIIRMPPMRYPDHPADLMLPSDRLAEQRAGGTWSELFNSQAIHNRFQPLGVVIWYLAVSLLGLGLYPLLCLALPGLADHGYPLARTAGLLVLSYLAWLAGSLRIPFTQQVIAAIYALLLLAGVALAWQQRDELRQEFAEKRNYYLVVESLMLAFFLFFLLVRLGNPDLWHPWKGGEKPMDFSYFNAVLRSTSFPPFDPWYSGGYLNYYYYGFVLVGTLVKMLGLVPAFAYNLILPTLFSLIAMGSFSLAWNLVARVAGQTPNPADDPTGRSTNVSPYIPAIAGALGTAVLGNLGTIRMLYQGFQRLAAPGGDIDGANLLLRLSWAMSGFFKVFVEGAKLPYGLGDWYWLPSRAIPALGDVEPITEFPYFTVLYADLHAHLMALPLTLLCLGLLAGIVLGKARWKSAWGGAAWFVLAGLSIGALRPTNTWDFPVYLALGILAVGYAIWHSAISNQQSAIGYFWPGLSTPVERWLRITGGVLLLVSLSFLSYHPFAQWYALGYTKVRLWDGSHTPTTAYLVHWGLFLFLIVSWMFWQSIDWMAKTPFSALRRFKGLEAWIIATATLLAVAVAGLVFFMEVYIAWLALPLAVWAGLLLLRPGQSDAKRLVLFLVGTGLTLTLMVEIIVLTGDIGRMNTVFKFYLQVWVLFSVSAAAALGWLLEEALPQWSPGWRGAWQAILTLLIAACSMYTLTATMAKVEDRMATEAPHTLDGMAYMPYAQYFDEWGAMNLAQDYDAIRWLQENVSGSPVIVEANLRNLYRWGSRMTIYTGLPGVVGWEWHQQQQRNSVPGTWVSERIAEIDNFYLTTSLIQAGDFLHKYDVRYIIVGQQERGHYPGPGLDKFEDADGALWREVFRSGETVIYEVLPER